MHVVLYNIPVLFQKKGTFISLPIYPFIHPWLSIFGTSLPIIYIDRTTSYTIRIILLLSQQSNEPERVLKKKKKYDSALRLRNTESELIINLWSDLTLHSCVLANNSGQPVDGPSFLRTAAGALKGL